MNSSQISPQELLANLELLRERIARKPAGYVPRQHRVRSIEDSFEVYVRTRQVNYILSMSDALRVGFDWPFPFFVFYLSDRVSWLVRSAFPVMLGAAARLRFKSLSIKDDEGYPRRKLLIESVIDRSMCRLVRSSLPIMLERWKTSGVISDHRDKLKEVGKVYSKGYWYVCVAALFPLLDHVCRKLLGTKNLMKGVGQLNKLFSKANIDLESLRPGSGYWDYARKVGQDPEQAREKDLRLVGIALESFLRFASVYYGHCDEGSEAVVLNRHAVQHGAVRRVWTKEDATRLLLFLDLMICLVPVFKILLARQPELAHSA